MKYIPTLKKTFSIRQTIRDMWKVFLREWKVLVAGALIYVAISYLLGGENKSRSLGIISLLIHLVMIYLYFGVIRVLFRMIRGEAYTSDHLKTDGKTILSILGAFVLYIIPFVVSGAIAFLLVGPGLLAVAGPVGVGVGVSIIISALIVACLIYSVRFGMYYFFIIDKGMKPLAALQASMQATKGSTLRLIAFIVLTIIAFVIGSMFLGLGLLIVLPLYLLCHLAIYDKLAKHMSGESSEFPIVQPAEIVAPDIQK